MSDEEYTVPAEVKKGTQIGDEVNVRIETAIEMHRLLDGLAMPLDALARLYEGVESGDLVIPGRQVYPILNGVEPVAILFKMDECPHPEHSGHWFILPMVDFDLQTELDYGNPDTIHERENLLIGMQMIMQQRDKGRHEFEKKWGKSL